jgi:hypothetical protein
MTLYPLTFLFVASSFSSILIFLISLTNSSLYCYVYTVKTKGQC